MLRSSALSSALVIAASTCAADCDYTLQLFSSQADDWGGALVVVTIGALGGQVQTYEYTVLDGGSASYPIQANVGDFVTLAYQPSGANASGHSVRLLASNGWTIGNWAMPPTGGLFHGFMVSIICNIPPAPVSDCLGAAQLTAGPTLDMTVAPGSTGNIADLNSMNQGCLGDEQAGFWVQYFADVFGVVSMELTALSGGPGVEVDFAVWGPVISPSCINLGAPLRCSRAATGWPTGLAPHVQDESEGVDGDGWVQSICADAPAYYLFYVSVTAPQSVVVRMVISNSGSLADCLSLSAQDRPMDGFKLFPLPAVDRLRLGQPIGAEGAAIIAMDGSAIQRVGAGASEIDVSGLPPGAYVLRTAAQVARFIVAR